MTDAPDRAYRRVGYHADPAGYVPVELCTFNHRFDDARQRFRSIYVAELAETALREMLADLRPKAAAIRRYIERFGPGAADDVPALPVTASWREQHVLVQLRPVLDGPLIDLCDADVRYEVEPPHGGYRPTAARGKAGVDEITGERDDARGERGTTSCWLRLDGLGMAKAEEAFEDARCSALRPALTLGQSRRNPRDRPAALKAYVGAGHDERCRDQEMGSATHSLPSRLTRPCVRTWSPREGPTRPIRRPPTRSILVPAAKCTMRQRESRVGSSGLPLDPLGWTSHSAPLTPSVSP